MLSQLQKFKETLCFERRGQNTKPTLLTLTPTKGALAETKKKAVQVRDKLVAAGEMREGIDEKREQYRPVATRGAVMYFTIVDLSLVNVMYQTSLDQFQTLFTRCVLRPERGAMQCQDSLFRRLHRERELHG